MVASILARLRMIEESCINPSTSFSVIVETLATSKPWSKVDDRLAIALEPDGFESFLADCFARDQPLCGDCNQAGGELLVSGERPPPVDGGGTAVHEQRDAEGLGDLLRRRAEPGRPLSVVGDAAVALLDNG